MPGADAHDPLLEVRGVAVRFGGVTALRDLSFDVRPGEICGLIGPNGAGKTTLFNCITRIYEPAEGSIRFAGRDLLAVPAHRIAGLGIARTFQNLALFGSMTVLDNVLTGAAAQPGTGIVPGLLAWPGATRRTAALRARAWELVEQLELLDVALLPAAGLPFGTRKRVELARALMAEPSLLLLDEPAGGLTHAEVDELGGLLVALRDRFGFAALLVEHHMGLVMGISDRVVAMDFGRRIAAGSPDEVRRDPAVVAAYLGRAA
ncbi:ABC transporter ATP-binding protein [Klenkia brasiliensis]|uniref:Amino acid/amide ABC transporter ATP-binding protein 1, HAAT family (TC 3.A.1.4.-) n=1 Tax=Klenkia brasiliensis TaxID=333142 RepID=A0A1G8A3W5_9ACTN|nr:ABC transporter ATP-binding protein [Klenkia brasiliensis]SDH15675.1 amino acid/amide ABC transporter ATP-binding protein 1, HAAT family (TC 3.A.1.4.-) [Klenkia brasiliensis]